MLEKRFCTCTHGVYFLLMLYFCSSKNCLCGQINTNAKKKAKLPSGQAVIMAFFKFLQCLQPSIMHALNYPDVNGLPAQIQITKKYGLYLKCAPSQQSALGFTRNRGLSVNKDKSVYCLFFSFLLWNYLLSYKNLSTHQGMFKLVPVIFYVQGQSSQ